MLISEVIAAVKAYHKGTFMGEPINEETTRDKVLYGDANKECTGIVTSCWASTDVIRAAAEMGANLIIVHEALFWNHGDHTEWLQNNRTFNKKKELLDKTGIVVWRDHDYIHSGIPMEDGSWTDGIFYGVAKVLGWEKYLVDVHQPTMYEIPETKASDVAEYVKNKLGLDTVRMLGDLDAPVKKIWVIGHVFGDANNIIEKIDKDGIDMAVSLELIDFTLSEYIRDAAMMGEKKAILALGHFNSEEPGMDYMVTYLPKIVGNIPVKFVKSGDMFRYISR